VSWLLLSRLSGGEVLLPMLVHRPVPLFRHGSSSLLVSWLATRP